MRAMYLIVSSSDDVEEVSVCWRVRRFELVAKSVVEALFRIFAKLLLFCMAFEAMIKLAAALNFLLLLLLEGGRGGPGGGGGRGAGGRGGGGGGGVEAALQNWG
mgnify:CR=1 FL=1